MGRNDRYADSDIISTFKNDVTYLESRVTYLSVTIVRIEMSAVNNLPLLVILTINYYDTRKIACVLQNKVRTVLKSVSDICERIIMRK